MKIRDCMTQEVRTVGPENTLQEAARIMAEIDAGAIPVGENDRLVGMLTDRDIAVRAIAAGKGPETPVRDVMTREVKYCFEDDDAVDVAENMSDLRVRRLPVLNRDKRLTGIVALSNLTQGVDASTAGQTIAGISRPGGPHSQH